MSADNWATCPNCLKKKESEREAAIAKAARAYGKISSEEWKAMDEAAHKEIELEQTFREDYEIGIDGAEFSVSYRGSCRVCGLAHNFKHEEKLGVNRD